MTTLLENLTQCIDQEVASANASSKPLPALFSGSNIAVPLENVHSLYHMAYLIILNRKEDGMQLWARFRAHSPQPLPTEGSEDSFMDVDRDEMDIDGTGSERSCAYQMALLWRRVAEPWFQRDHAAAFRSLGDLSEGRLVPLGPLATEIRGRLRLCRTEVLVGAYARVGLRSAALFLGYGAGREAEQEAKVLLCTLGWKIVVASVQNGLCFLSPPSKVDITSAIKDPIEQISQLTTYISFLERKRLNF
eukprot:CAMPEP_0194273596 /NCGR_PEP_ID=MMETSP0169-20130528/6906_1 /TAXON_ID=218684 /ORGANISM="Corethron pennatum, Strain L29A3" /LENGTH=247 /DNA_ID=CAMNT_0039016599 /DNA_START=209 /DNA_END=952 /DNA_ORIENTATION=-